jgi:nitrogenase iron protein NifH
VTTIEGAPDSEQAEVYRNLARKVIDNKNKFLPTPFENDDLADWASGWINKLLLNKKIEKDNIQEGSSGI